MGARARHTPPGYPEPGNPAPVCSKMLRMPSKPAQKGASAPRRPQKHQRWLQDGPRYLQDTLRGLREEHQEGSRNKKHPNATESAFGVLIKQRPRRTKRLPRPLQDGPKGSQESPKTAQEASQDGLKKGANAPRRPQKQPRWPQDGPRGLRENQQEGPRIITPTDGPHMKT